MRHIASLVAAIGLPALAACSGELVSASLGPSGRTGFEGGAGATSSHPAELVGSWLRTVSFYGSDGSLHLSETRWDFSASGVATRVVTTTNITFGFSDTVVSSARWRIEGGLLVLDYVPPDSGTARFAWRVEDLTGGTQLVIDGTVFQKVPR